MKTIKSKSISRGVACVARRLRRIGRGTPRPYITVILFIVLALAAVFCGCTKCGCAKYDYELREVYLSAIVIPGAANSDEEITIKYVWQGGGCSREIGDVQINQNGNRFTIKPLINAYIGGGGCTCDIFHEVGYISLGNLTHGIYYIDVIGKNMTFHDSLTIPTSADDSLFKFRFSAIGTETGQFIADVTVGISVFNEEYYIDTCLQAITDSNGIAEIQYYSPDDDSIFYSMEFDGSTKAFINKPEYITLAK